LLTAALCFSPAHAHKYKDKNSVGTMKKEEKEPIEPIVVRVTGYGAYERKEDSESESKRLMAIRASKLDAYRTLAERLYGIGISGGSQVDEFVMKSDHYAAAVDSYVRGARVVSIIENKGRGFETVLEILLPGDFHDCINKMNNIKFGIDCHRPLPMASSSEPRTKRAASQSMQSVYFLK
ncbi:LPP20 family lipoprotein, partial [Oleiphilus sp. HI0123]